MLTKHDYCAGITSACLQVWAFLLCVCYFGLMQMGA